MFVFFFRNSSALFFSVYVYFIVIFKDLECAFSLFKYRAHPQCVSEHMFEDIFARHRTVSTFSL